MFKERTYRRWVESDDLIAFEVKEKETDLYILASKKLENQAREAILTYRTDIERYILKDPEFYTALVPMNVAGGAPPIIHAMAEAARKAGVGPMAAVAGAVAEFVGRDLLAFSDDVIVENGGDIFLKVTRRRVMGIYAGERSPFTGKLAIEVGPSSNGIGACTSSGTVSHSLSFGNADAALIISDDTALADAIATATGNMVKGPNDVEKAVNFAKSINGARGVLVIIGDKMGSWGDIKFV